MATPCPTPETIAVIDFETTGMGPGQGARATEIAVVLVQAGRVVDRYRHGAPLVGIGGYRDGNDSFIVIATKDALEGYRVDDVALD